MIYFIHDPDADAIKIGVADDPKKRLGQLQVGCAGKLTLVAAIPGGRDGEAKLHQRFRHLRLRGEWFRADAELMEFSATIEAKRLGPFLELAKLEPDLWKLYEEAKGHRDLKDQTFCANAVWYGYPGYDGIKPRLLPLIGWSRRGHDVLGTCKAYDIAYRTIYEALPDCRGDCECSVFFNALVGA